jgi:hypothetical protein
MVIKKEMWDVLVNLMWNLKDNNIQDDSELSCVSTYVDGMCHQIWETDQEDRITQRNYNFHLGHIKCGYFYMVRKDAWWTLIKGKVYVIYTSI